MAIHTVFAMAFTLSIFIISYLIVESILISLQI